MIHVVPVHDIGEHELTTSCWCRPQALAEGGDPLAIIVHAAGDGREHHERAGLHADLRRPWQAVVVEPKNQ